MLNHDVEIIKFCDGYSIGTVNKDKIICRASKIYKSREEAENDLKGNKYKLRESCSEGCNRCTYGLSTSGWGFIKDEELDEDIKRYYFNLDAPEYTDLGKLGKELVIDVFYNFKEKKITDIILHDGNMHKIDYEFNERELVKIYNWIDALNSVALKKLDLVRSKLKNIDLKLSIMALAKEKGNEKIYSNYYEEIKRELGSIFKDDVLNDIMQDLIDNL